MNPFIDFIVVDGLFIELAIYLPAPDICRITRTSRAVFKVVQDNIKQIFNLYRCLNKFFDNPNDFRQLQAETGLVISGSFALQFFTRRVYDNVDLDLFAVTHAKQKIASWLLANGYRYHPREATYDSETKEQLAPPQPKKLDILLTKIGKNHYAEEKYIPGAIAVIDFVRGEEDGAQDKIQLIIVDTCPMKSILSFHSSTFALRS